MGYKLRRSRIYVPSNTPRMLSTCALFGADVITLDLEDSVAPDQKVAARWLVAEALRDLDMGESEITVRVNALDTPWGKDDVRAVVATGAVDGVYLPKAETPRQIMQLAGLLDEVEAEHDIDGETTIVPLIESARGMMHAYDIALASDRITALSFGGEDYTRDVGGEKTSTEEELGWPRQRLIAAAKAAGKQALDTVYSDVQDLEGLHRQAVKMRQLGFDGKAAIHPNQVDVIHRAFNPTREEIEHALEVMQAIKEARARGSGVASLGRKMVDKPVVERAQRVLMIARLGGLIDEEKIPDIMEEM
ncbi:MAG: CoA ester lyase [Thermoplasmatota archaeon]